MANDKQSEIFETLLDAGCCKRCALRFLGDFINIDFDSPELYIKNIVNGVLDEDDKFEHVLKKPKINPCVVCLDILQDSLLEEMVAKPELKAIAEYDSENFVNFISFPTAVLIREHSMEIYMRDKYPDFFKDNPIVPINKAWSLSILNKLGKRLGKKFNKSAPLLIQFTATYDLENEETSVMYLLEKDLNKTKKKNEILSRNVIGESLKSIEKDVFKKHVPVPPAVPLKPAIAHGVTYSHDPIFIGGRYCKYSRNMGQTPWVVDNVKICENSVQEIIFEALDNVFNCTNLVFSSSGREDFDVRMLGRGRPFFIKICDPKITRIPAEKFRSIEEQIRKTNLVEVKYLQFIDKKSLTNVKEGEQFKQKTYRALCIINEADKLGSFIEKINSVSNVTLKQKTPIRVYHRRSASVREKEIYSLKATPITGRENLFELELVTQAGTYVKEFVHGDLGRTKPSLGNIIDGYVDIITLDVLDIHLDFPLPVDH